MIRLVREFRVTDIEARGMQEYAACSLLVKKFDDESLKGPRGKFQ